MDRRQFLLRSVQTVGAAAFAAAVPLDRALAGTAATTTTTTAWMPLVKGLMTRSWFDGRPWNVEVRWRDLQPVAGGPLVHPNAIDNALAKGAPFRVRLLSGQFAPQWAKELAGGPVPYVEPVSGAVATVPRWWTWFYMQAHKDVVAKLAAAYDGKISLIFVSGGMSFYAEPLLRGFADPRNRDALMAAGFTAERDTEKAFATIDQHRVFKHTRIGMSLNPYQRLRTDGSWFHDPSFAEAVMSRLRANFGGRAVLQNNSIRTPAVAGPYTELYADLRAHAEPLSFQTATLARVGDLSATLEWAIAQGAHAVELPYGYQERLTSTQLTDFDLRLKAN
jgi:hypothetical protein